MIQMVTRILLVPLYVILHMFIIFVICYKFCYISCSVHWYVQKEAFRMKFLKSKYVIFFLNKLLNYHKRPNLFIFLFLAETKLLWYLKRRERLNFCLAIINTYTYFMNTLLLLFCTDLKIRRCHSFYMQHISHKYTHFLLLLLVFNLLIVAFG